MYLTSFSLAFICFINFSLLCPCFYLCNHFYYYPFLKLRSLIATSSLCKLVKMADHDQLCGHTGGVVPIDSDCWDDNFFVQAQHYEQLWLELVNPSCHPPSSWTRAPCPVLGVQKDCNCNHESHVLIYFKAMQVISRFTPACKFHSEVCGYGIQIPTMIWFTRLIY